MPPRVDHDARRRQILDALCRITIRGGLGAATFRQVAAEAGVSVRLVQYYFGTKRQLLDAAHDYVLVNAAQRLLAAIDDTPDDAPPEAVIRAAMASFLPTDQASRDAMVLFYAFFAAQLTDEGGPDAETERGSGLGLLFSHHIVRGQRDGTVPGDLDPDKEALLLFLTLPSLASGVIAESLTLDDAEALIDYRIGRLFSGTRSRGNGST